MDFSPWAGGGWFGCHVVIPQIATHQVIAFQDDEILRCHYVAGGFCLAVRGLKPNSAHLRLKAGLPRRVNILLTRS